MQVLVVMLGLMASGFKPDLPDQIVRIGLFSLFKPHTLYVQVLPGDSAQLDAGRLAHVRTEAGDTIRIRVSGNQLSVLLVDSYGRVKSSASASEVQIAAERSGVLDLTLPGRLKRQVRGRLKVIGESTGQRRQLSVILSADREAAVASVVAAEISGAREIEAIKALAVVVRTFMLAHAGRHKVQGFDFCDTTHCQLYRGETDLAAELVTPLVANAVALSKGEFLSFNGRGIEGHYSAACGGTTLAPEVVWGGQVASGYPFKSVSCAWCRGSNYYRWERRAQAQALLAAIASKGQRASSDAEIIVESDEPGAVARSVVIRDRHSLFRLTPDEFRRRVGQRLGWNRVLSPTFSVERRGNSFIFRGRGFGSQVGLCVAGALAQAKAGRTRDAILSFYYPQTAVERDL